MIKRNITYINPKDPVSATVTNKPLSQLKQETDKLQAEFETTEAGNTLVYKNIPCDSSVRVGMPVYWDNTAQCCKPAYVCSEYNETTREYVTGTPSDCIGLAYKKWSDQSVDILISGMIDFPAIRTYLNGNTGRFYLDSQPGMLTCKPCSHAFPLGVAIGPMGPCDTAYRVYFNPCYTTSLFQHQHFSIDLAPVKDTEEERAIPGWSEVSQQYDTGFPTGAVYIYNLEAHEELDKVWPPIPLDAISATVEWVSSEKTGGKELTVNKSDSLIKVTEDGIYWMSSTYLPFTTPASDGCTNASRVTLNFSKIKYSNRNDFVTSLQPDVNQPFKFVDCKGNDAKSGDLYAKFTLKDNPIVSEDYDGWAVKKFRDDWKSEKVPVVNALKISGNVAITSTNQLEDDYHAGAVSVTLSPYAANTELSPQIIKVGAAQEREVYGITYLGLPAGRSSSLRLKFEIPSNYASQDTACTFKLRTQCIAPITGTFPVTTVEYLRIPRANTDTEINLAELHTQDMSYSFVKNVEVGHIYEIEGDTPITVYPGDTIIVIISRAANSGYSADLAIARVHGVINVA